MDNHNSESLDLLKIRHSCVHILMEAMQQLHPGILKAMGPATKDGFYFDFELPEGIKLSEANFPSIEQIMQQTINSNLEFHKKEVSIDQARQLFANNPYKQEWLNDIEKNNAVPTLYWTGDYTDAFYDLCAGPHVANTSEIKAFKLLSLAGAY